METHDFDKTLDLDESLGEGFSLNLTFLPVA